MADEAATAVLEFGLERGQSADAIIAAKALIEWAEAIKATVRIADPGGSVSIDLISAEPACLRFSTVLRFVEEHLLGGPDRALAPYPRIRKLLALNVLILPGTILGGVAINMLGSEADNEEVTQQISESPEVRQRVQNFYRVIQCDPAITKVIVRESPNAPPIIEIDRAEFGERSGLWQPEESGPVERQGGGEWDVVVTHPVALGRPLTWKFMRDGLPFQAKMADRRFLDAIKSGTLPLNIQEGVMMKIRLSYRERREGQVWVPVKGTYVVEEVIDPSPKRSTFSAG